MTFKTTLLQSGKTSTGIIVPPSVVEALGGGKRAPVVVTINGHSYRSSVAVMGGDFMVGVSAENREKAGIAGGDAIEVTLELDTQPRVVEIPKDLANALAAEPKAQAFFQKLSYSHQLRHVLVINDAKTAETRSRRIEKAVDMLREGKK